MPSVKYRTRSDSETVALGRKLAPELPRGVVLLVGNLGAGKTTLAKGIVAALTSVSEEEVASPTFTLIHDYGEVVHIDLYRLETEREVETLGLDEIVDGARLTLVEWGERFPRLFPNAPRITLRTVAEDERELEVQLSDHEQ